MCGIAGYWSLKQGAQKEFERDLGEAVGVMHHRGPDDNGVWVGESGVGLGHARLSILDLSSHGHQPMRSEDGRYVMVFNGEVYNFREIRLELEACGCAFVSDGDSEVVLAAFQQWGKDCVQRFIGMFAIAIWDNVECRLWLCRDRVGVKPLYYGWDGETFWFGSELKALLTFKHWYPKLNRQAVGEFLQYGYIAAPRSIFQQVKKLMPGHWLELSSPSEKGEDYQYWSVLDAVRAGPVEKSEDELMGELEEVLVSAFKYRMVSDVPVGVFLSGGIDSSIVAAILAKYSDQPVHTYTIGFNDKECDESIWAKKVASHIGSEHTEYTIDMDKAKEIIPNLPKLYDEPFGDASAVPTSMVSQLAGRDVKVVLSADGGDELFGGYSRYVFIPDRMNRVLNKPAWLRKIIGQILSFLPIESVVRKLSIVPILGPKLVNGILQKVIKLKILLPKASEASTFSVFQSYFMEPEVVSFLGGYEDPRKSIARFSGCFEEKMMQDDFLNYLPDDIMTKVDRATMGVSIEGREPLLDHRLIEFAFKLPIKYRFGKLGQKHLLRKVLYKYVPRSLIDRPKQGFGVPIDDWMQAEDYVLANSLLQSSSPINNVLNMSAVRQEVNLFKQTHKNGTRVWFLYVLNQWLIEYDIPR